MKSAVRILVGVLVGTLLLSGCGYQGWVRYACQEYENWNKPECKPPQCVPTGVCTEDLIGSNE